jgi:UDP-GlcNAc:undecaprenyl-phosphate GlcNAc-1-phosphate transferase
MITQRREAGIRQRVAGDGTAAIAALVCALVVTLTEPVTISLMRRAAAIDIPGHRSSHRLPTPRGGGVAIAAGLLTAAAVTGDVPGFAFGATVAAFGLIGLAEDLTGVAALPRLALQLAAGLLAGLVLVSELAVPGPMMAVLAVLAAVWITAFVNAFNFMDGVNGISGAHAALAGTLFALLGWWRGDGFLLAAGAALAAGGLAFLPWNAGRARVFLGDVGSYALGAAVAVLACYGVIQGVPPEAALGPVALYLTDTGWTLYQRARRGERLLEAHRGHVYQRWTDAGWSHQRVTAITVAASGFLCLAGLVSLTGPLATRAAADLVGGAALLAYACSPGPLLRRAARRGDPATVAAAVGVTAVGVTAAGATAGEVTAGVSAPRVATRPAAGS